MKKILNRNLVNPVIWSNTYTALKCLVDNSYYTQITMPEEERKEGDIGLRRLKEICTVRIGSSRQSGHTTAICKLAEEYFNRALILCPNLDIAKNTYNLFIGTVGTNKIYSTTAGSVKTVNNCVYSFGSICDSFDKYRGMNFEAIIIDGTFSLNSKKEDEIYNVLGACMSNNPQRFFIFIQ